MHDTYWVSNLRGILSINDAHDPITVVSERQWVNPESVRGEAVGDIIRQLTDVFYGNYDLPLHIEIAIEPQEGHGQKYRFVPTPVDS